MTKLNNFEKEVRDLIESVSLDLEVKIKENLDRKRNIILIYYLSFIYELLSINQECNSLLVLLSNFRIIFEYAMRGSYLLDKDSNYKNLESYFIQERIKKTNQILGIAENKRFPNPNKETFIKKLNKQIETYKFESTELLNRNANGNIGIEGIVSYNSRENRKYVNNYDLHPYNDNDMYLLYRDASEVSHGNFKKLIEVLTLDDDKKQKKLLMYKSLSLKLCISLLSDIDYKILEKQRTQNFLELITNLNSL